MFWRLQDSLLYFDGTDEVNQNEPIAFIVTGSIQLIIDGILITQMIIYREKPDKTKSTIE